MLGTMMKADSKKSAIVRTVLGEIDPAQLGVTLMHEHPIHRLSNHSGSPDNTCVDVDLVVQELALFREAGGGTVCDVTPIQVGRDTAALAEVSERSGVTIVSAFGLYQLDVWSDDILALSRDALADFIVRETEGDATGVPAGFIGEVATHNEPGKSDWKQYRLWDRRCRSSSPSPTRSAARDCFSRRTPRLGGGGVAQLRVIADAGGDTSRVIIGHCDAMAHDDPALDFDYYEQILDFGAIMEFDLFGWGDVFFDDAIRIARLAELIRRGHADRLLLATDTCRLSQLQANGGRGFAYLFNYVLPALRDLGVPETDIHQITVANPARVLTLEPA